MWEDHFATDEALRTARSRFKEAMENAELYLAAAPPDARQRSTVLNWYIVVKVIAEARNVHDDPSSYEVRAACLSAHA